MLSEPLHLLLLSTQNALPLVLLAPSYPSRLSLERLPCFFTSPGAPHCSHPVFPIVVCNCFVYLSEYLFFVLLPHHDGSSVQVESGGHSSQASGTKSPEKSKLGERHLDLEEQVHQQSHKGPGVTRRLTYMRKHPSHSPNVQTMKGLRHEVVSALLEELCKLR